MKGLHLIVLAKQVPDTRHVGKDSMKSDGTINRAALPAIFNPDDLKGLEQALRIKDRYPDTKITVITMGPPRAASILRESLYRGADRGILITDKRFAGSDTLATSYSLALAIRKAAPFDIVFAGRQAIDGDTAQVGPQTAEKLGIPQVTYAESIQEIQDGKVIVHRRLEQGLEILSAPMPVLITVHGIAPECRPRNAKRLMKYKYARTATELKRESDDILALHEKRHYLEIEEWSVEDIGADIQWLGLAGSPTKVKKVENVVLQAKDSKVLEATDEAIESLVKELIDQHTIG